MSRIRYPTDNAGNLDRFCPGSARACESLSSVLLLDPIHGGGHAEHAHEAAGRLLVAGRNRTPLLEPGPETLDAVAVHVDPGRARDGRLIALGRDRWTRAELPDEVTECLTGVAAIGHNPGRARPADSPAGRARSATRALDRARWR